MPEPITNDENVSEAGATGAEGSNTLSEVELARKRQSGAEKARLEAERQRDEAMAQLQRFQQGAKPGENAALDIESAIKAAKAELKAEFEAEYAKKSAASEAAALDAAFPNARTKFPSVTDRVQLAELEGLYGETTEPPKPIGNSPARTTSGEPDYDSMSSADIRKAIEALDPSEAGIVVRR